MSKILNYLSINDATTPSADWPEPSQAHLYDSEIDGPQGTTLRFYDYTQAAVIFGRSPRTIRWWVKTGRLRAIKIGRARFITEAQILSLQSDGEC